MDLKKKVIVKKKYKDIHCTFHEKDSKLFKMINKWVQNVL